MSKRTYTLFPYPTLIRSGFGDAAVAVERDRVAAETGHLRAERRHLGGAEEAGEEEEAVAAVIFKLTARQRALGLLDAAVHNRVQPGQDRKSTRLNSSH